MISYYILDQILTVDLLIFDYNLYIFDYKLYMLNKLFPSKTRAEILKLFLILIY
jgi:hypothetical protein